MNMQLPAPVRYAMNALTKAGYQVYVVGGSVRDVLLGKQPHDFDLTTSALPEEMLALFERDRVLVNGIKHGTVTLIKYGMPVEMTTFRIDGEYSDGRHPDDIEFTGNLYEDVRRRDFTVNALCWNEQTGLIDYVGGEEDIAARVIRCVGDPDRRFNEDALRILRALRFSATLDFDIDPPTAQSALRNCELLQKIAVERVLTELRKLLTGPRAEAVLLEFRPVFQVFLPELASLSADQYMLTARRVSLVAPAEELRLAALLYGLSAGQVAECACRLRFSKASRKLIGAIGELSARELPADRIGMRRALGELGEELLCGLIELRVADLKALCHLVIQQGDCVSLKGLAVKGEDVFRAGISRRRTGQCLNMLLEMVISDQVPNEREALLGAVQSIREEVEQLPPAKRQVRRKRTSPARVRETPAADEEDLKQKAADRAEQPSDLF